MTQQVESIRSQHERELVNCCIGSRAAFAKLLLDRQSLSDAELKAIIQRLAKVTGEHHG